MEAEGAEAAAPAPAPAHAGVDLKTKLQAVGIAVSPTVAIFMLALNKVLDPFADYFGYPPIDIQRRMIEQRYAVQRLVAMRDDYILADPSPGSRQAWLWLRRVEQLQQEDSENYRQYVEGGVVTASQCAREASKIAKRAEDAASQFKELSVEAKARPHPLKGSDWKDPSLLASPYKEPLLSFLNDRSGKCSCLGIWGMPGVGKTALVRNVARCHSEGFAATDTSFRTISVNVGTDFTIEKLQKTICAILGLTVTSDVTESPMSHAIANRLRGMNFVLILDDVSSPIDLTRLGIPDPIGNLNLSTWYPTKRPAAAQTRVTDNPTAAQPTANNNTENPSANGQSSSQTGIPHNPTAPAPAADDAAAADNDAPDAADDNDAPDAAADNRAPDDAAAADNTAADGTCSFLPGGPIGHDAARSRVILTCQKVIITTNKQSVCASMGCRQMIHMLPASQEDATKIFNQAVGYDVIEDRRLGSFARQIITECGRLPEALSKVGHSLSIKRSIEEWKFALKMLRQGRVSVVTYKNDNLIGRLRRTYEDLDDNVKDCFLICSMWEENVDIPIDTLIQMWRGRGLLDELDGHAEGYNYIRMMQQACLLEFGHNNLRSNECTHVRMNGMIHKAALQILSDKNEKWAVNSPWRQALSEAAWNEADSAWIKEDDLVILRSNRFSKMELPSKVQVLVTRCKMQLSQFQFHAIVFLDLETVELDTFPHAICKMITLEYINMSSTEIRSIPEGLGDLDNLKSLRLRLNGNLSEIAAGVIAKLGKLMELDLFGTECLLTEQLENELKQSDTVHLLVGVTLKSADEVMRLMNLTRLCRVSALYICLEKFNSGHIINLGMLSDCNRLRELRVIDCNAVSLVAERLDGIEDGSMLNSLRSVAILNVPYLTEIRLPTSGLNITSVTIGFAQKLVELTWIAELVNVEQIQIFNCCMVTTLVSSSMTEQQQVRLPRLKMLYLSKLPELSSLSELPMQLESIVHFGISGCSKLAALAGFLVEQRDPKVIIDSDEEFHQKISQDSTATKFILRVADRRVLQILE